ncbi:sensor histidine kinase [Phenylobacterium sp.]|uniref:sensor histidine kinase n=1 Tax=Phenylobacterium sp. TaxID=1871053 RepID=UPI00374D47C3
MSSDPLPGDMGQLLENPALADALENEQFQQFLDQVPVAIAVSKLQPTERIVYANDAFERLTGEGNRELVGARWDRLPESKGLLDSSRSLSEILVEERDHVGAFVLSRVGSPLEVDAWSNIIEDESGVPLFRLVALVEVAARDISVLDELQDQLREKDTQLLELQHRVKNNLQMITALIRVEAKGISDRSLGEGFDRLAGRVEALGLLYRALGEPGHESAVDLGIYLSEIASAVMRAHAVEGIRLVLQVDTWPVSIDVAMPTGLVVNELMTNALKHAFVGRSGGTIRLLCTNLASGCRVVVADDGVGLPPGVSWPRPGKLSALIVRSLQQNAQAHIEIQSAPGAGSQVTIVFSSTDAAPP